jgi:hypothetical protein
MHIDDYRALTAALRQNLATDPRVLGFVALGSMAEQDITPDRWSDHDFFVITHPGQQEPMRSDFSWIPQAERIAFSFRETAHGLKVVYDNGHLLEFAVFDPEELNVAQVNRYQVLLDRAQIADQVGQIAQRTAQDAISRQADDRAILGQFLSNLIVGVGRYRRGERLSGHQYVRSHAMEHLVALLAKYVPTANDAILDNLSPMRRFELVYPDLGAELDAIAALPPPEAAVHMLALAQRELQLLMPSFPDSHLRVTKRYLTHQDAEEVLSG